MSATAFLDACGFIPTSGGTGTWTVSAAVQGYQTIAAAATAQGVASGAILSYRAESSDKSVWEEGYGATGSLNTTLARTVTANSSGTTSAINFSAAPNVFITAATADLQNAALLTSGLLPGGRVAPLLRSYLAGLTLSTAGSSSSFGVAAGVAADSTNADIMVLSSALTKTTSAWAAGSGNGALDTGAIANSTWYHVHLIYSPTSGAVDALVSLSATAPTLPSGYTRFRRIGSMLTDASSHWTAFHQLGDEFLWDAAVASVPTQAYGAASSVALLTMTVPTGVQVWAQFEWALQESSGGGSGVLLSSPDVSDQTPFIIGFTDYASVYSSATYIQAPYTILRTNTSGQIRARLSAYTGTASNWAFYTKGWIDRRGRDN